MAKRTRLSEEVRRTIAMRVHNGEDKEELASEFSVSKYTVADYAKQFKKPRKVKRKVVPSPSRENTRVFTDRVRELEAERDVWKSAYMAVITDKE